MQNKDASILCQLSNYEVYFVHGPALEALRAPKPYAFALKSKLPRVHYEDQDQYMFFTSVKTSEEVTVWVRALLEARVSLRSSVSITVARRELNCFSLAPVPIESNRT